MISDPTTPVPSVLDARRRLSIAETYSTDAFVVKPCAFGLGVFARRAIAPGEVILPFGGPLIDFAETKRRGPLECMAIQIGPDLYFDTRPPGVFVNHSCDPNAGIRNDHYLVALRWIAKGREISFDYSTTMDEQSFTMDCLCGAPGCRKVIGDFSTLPAATQERYIAQRIVMNFILKRRRSAAPEPSPATRRKASPRPRLLSAARG